MRRLITIAILLAPAIAGSAPDTFAQAPEKQTPQPKQPPQDVPTVRSVALDPEVVKPVKRVGSWKSLTAEEYDAYYYVLAHAQKVDERRLQTAARDLQKRRRAAYPKLLEDPDAPFPAFVDLLHHPELYRGQPVTLKGHVRRFVEQPAGKNEQGIETLYEAWLFTEDSQGNPAVIICTSVPANFPKNEDLIDHVSATGYFFKQWVYPAQDDKHRLTPLILAHRLHWRPGPGGFGPAPGIVYVGAVVVIVVIVVLLWRSARKDRAYRQSPLGRDSEAADPGFAGLGLAGETPPLDAATGSDVPADEGDGTAPENPSPTNDPETDQAADRPLPSPQPED